MTDPVWTIYARNGALQRVAEIDDYQALEMVVRFNAVGTWVLNLDRRVTAAAAMFVTGAGIVVTRDNIVVLSGPVTKRRVERDGENYKAIISGVDDTVWLARRLAHPQPGSAAPPYSSTAYDVRTGLCSTVLHEFVNVNAGAGATPGRVVAALTSITDPLIGATVTGRARWQVLITMLDELAVAGGLGFRVVQSGTDLQFQTYAPTDKSAIVKFSEELGNLSSFNYESSAPSVTYIFNGGGGEGTARTITEGQDVTGAAEWGRLEQFTDRRDTTDGAELLQDIAKTLAEGSETFGIELAPIDTASQSYGIHYQLGDRVTVVVEDDTAISEIVREVKITLAAKMAERVVPSIGTPGRRDLQRLFGAVRDLSARTRNLERR